MQTRRDVQASRALAADIKKKEMTMQRTKQRCGARRAVVGGGRVCWLTMPGETRRDEMRCGEAAGRWALAGRTPAVENPAARDLGRTWKFANEASHSSQAALVQGRPDAGGSLGVLGLGGLQRPQHWASATAR